MHLICCVIPTTTTEPCCTWIQIYIYCNIIKSNTNFKFLLLIWDIPLLVVTIRYFLGKDKTMLQNGETLCCQNTTKYLALYSSIFFGIFWDNTQWSFARFEPGLSVQRYSIFQIDTCTSYYRSGPATGKIVLLNFITSILVKKHRSLYVLFC